MIEVKAPNEVTPEGTKVFLAGSIEMGKAEPWQERICKELESARATFFNPRRVDWDSSWKQDPTVGTKFHEQVTWELEHITDADLVIFYFDPATQSPITLLELGYILGLRSSDVIVCCPDGYFRKGNVVLTCNREGITVLDNFEELVNAAVDYLNYK